MSPWISIVSVQGFHLWRDVPAANELTLACSAQELLDHVLALPGRPNDPLRQHGMIAAEVRNRAGAVRKVRVSMTGVHPLTRPGKVHTGTGKGDWVVPGDVLRLVDFDDGMSPSSELG